MRLFPFSGLLFFVLLGCSDLIQAGSPDSLEVALSQGEQLRKNWPNDRPKTNPEIRVISGKYLTLYTDLPASFEIDRLPEIFDAAVPLWCDYFRVNLQNCRNWQMIGVLLGDWNVFSNTNLLQKVPQLRHGYSQGYWLWIRQQSSDYYQRHLLLHEGVHGLMSYLFGAIGPRWYSEGLAELLATHHWEEKSKQLTIRYMPENKEEVPNWGRIRLVREMVDLSELGTLQSLLTLPFDEDGDKKPYARNWAIAAFLDGHPQYGDWLRDLAPQVSHPDFNQHFLERIAQQPEKRLEWDWADFLRNLDYGYDFKQSAIADFQPGQPLKKGGENRTIPLGWGWTNTGIQVEKGQTYTFRARGQFQIRRNGETWKSEPNGVTLDYHAKFPIGLLIGSVIPTDQSPTLQKSNRFSADFRNPFAIGTGTVWKCEQTGLLFLRINEPTADLPHSRGTVQVQIE